MQIQMKCWDVRFRERCTKSWRELEIEVKWIILVGNKVRYEMTDFCLTCLVSRSSFYEDWRFHESLTWWEKGLAGSSSPCLSSCRRGRKKKKGPKNMKFHKVRLHVTMTQFNKSASYQRITPRRHMCEAAFITHAELHNLIEIKVTEAHV